MEKMAAATFRKRKSSEGNAKKTRQRSVPHLSTWERTRTLVNGLKTLNGTKPRKCKVDAFLS